MMPIQLPEPAVDYVDVDPIGRTPTVRAIRKVLDGIDPDLPVMLLVHDEETPGWGGVQAIAVKTIVKFDAGLGYSLILADAKVKDMLVEEANKGGV